jgi:hypothetical protein
MLLVREGIIGEGEKGERTKPDVTSSNTNPTRSGMGSNPGLRGEIPAMNCLSYNRVHNVNIILKLA